jgi:A/G-specific adenine glycosylase
VSNLAELLLDWYALHARKMPSVSDLANSTENEVLATWEGLGYYSRARNLRRAAQVVMNKHDGRLPNGVRELISLPGVGRYTAGAIASIAFKVDEPTMDGNIRRVFARLFDIRESVDTPSGERILWSLVEAELPKGRAGDFNQALMDLGAILCTPQNPGCEQCPLLNICQARVNGVQAERPILKAKPVQPQFTYVGAIIREGDSYLLVKRPSRGLLGGMWEFPNDRVVNEETNQEKNLESLMAEKFGVGVEIISKQGIFRHAYTHFRLILHAYNCKLSGDNLAVPDLCWVPSVELLNYPMGKVARQISRILMCNEK